MFKSACNCNMHVNSANAMKRRKNVVRHIQIAQVIWDWSLDLIMHDVCARISVSRFHFQFTGYISTYSAGEKKNCCSKCHRDATRRSRLFLLVINVITVIKPGAASRFPGPRLMELKSTIAWDHFRCPEIVSQWIASCNICDSHAETFRNKRSPLFHSETYTFNHIH